MHKVATLATMGGCSCPSEIKTVCLTDWFELKTVQLDIRKTYSTAESVNDWKIREINTKSFKEWIATTLPARKTDNQLQTIDRCN